ncbi:hypothetical protein [Mycobacterium xenopi]|uniref:hypothetical protein n=1 Tax=Mycobacterium xenopi TaxID=1789 RepID=UPI001C49907D|nr:hypothetical protein [Mycobacterium xenopi]MDA3642178.1 hypothetical protein [Mycobacterium xenopi]MDA3660272.1 hypothetical protein [Mycobacterium xenopi]MDA3664910.1 hypothetical protein [Mycobacterium xenopi]
MTRTIRRHGRSKWVRVSAQPSRRDLEYWLQMDAALARGWSYRLSRTAPISQFASAITFAEWCDEAAARLRTTDVVDLDALAREWQTQAERSGIEDQPLYVTTLCLFALLVVFFAAALVGSYVGFIGLATVFAVGGATVIFCESRVAPRLMVGPAAPRSGPLWFDRSQWPRAWGTR